MGPDENLWKKSSQLQGSQRAPELDTSTKYEKAA